MTAVPPDDDTMYTLPGLITMEEIEDVCQRLEKHCQVNAFVLTWQCLSAILISEKIGGVLYGKYNSGKSR